MTETLGKAVLDSACSQTGEIWFNIFFDTLNDQGKGLVETDKYNRIFCFGDAVEVKAIKTVKFPLTLGSVKVSELILRQTLSKMIYSWYYISHKSVKTAGMLLIF